MRRFLIATSAAVFVADPAGAQTGYASGRDTLRFREVTHAEIRLTTPQGEIPLTSEHLATIAMVRLPGDTARAWYEALTISASGPMGTQRPATDAALRAPFTLRFDDRGRVSLVSAPTFPATFQGITDLTHQFDDFFPRLPAQPLRVGLAWSDTATRTDSTAEKSMTWRSEASYRVERDTVVDGVSALVVRMTQRLRSRSEGPVPNQPARAETVIAGTEEGYFVFAPRAGRLLGRRREGRLAGDVIMRAGAGQMALKQTYVYTSTIDALR
jgi:hypothetical protein